MRGSRELLAVLVLLTPSACRDSSGPDSPVASEIVAFAGDGQLGFVATTSAPIVARVRSDDNTPIEGFEVHFEVSAGDAAVTASRVITDVNGLARSRVEYGTRAGRISVHASAAVPNSPAIFRLEAVPEFPRGVLIVSGNDQLGLPGAMLPQPLVARVVDRFDNDVPDVDVSFTVSRGSGSVEPASARTDARGRVQTQWRLGSSGEQQVIVTTENGKQAFFNALAR
ncbi:MAG: Ig-like domain-containing protein [Candidatus Latescibacterota bacterium]|nr:MAG: Ig-like domain-containing protein [Candidatus Latescibacterota bacterium]